MNKGIKTAASTALGFFSVAVAVYIIVPGVLWVGKHYGESAGLALLFINVSAICILLGVYVAWGDFKKGR